MAKKAKTCRVGKCKRTDLTLKFCPEHIHLKCKDNTCVKWAKDKYNGYCKQHYVEEVVEPGVTCAAGGGCERKVLKDGKGFCRKHYIEYVNSGELATYILNATVPELKYIQSVVLDARKMRGKKKDKCIIWPFGINENDGYGYTWHEGETWPVHKLARYVFERRTNNHTNLVGVHRTTCKHNCCFNPHHIELQLVPGATETDTLLDEDKMSFHGTTEDGDTYSSLYGAGVTWRDFTVEQILTIASNPRWRS